ncbi:glycosyltransferase [Massilia agri]|uniref:Glycosyltransferase n=1 Tax=Massilia agri TaxID=1886785 RepID=A0ABT2ALT9_9BURK|nr:glycosyltransferase [Massilia agri]MCS0597140.1 glycosyltransferase [Massilia agri]
MLKILTFSTLFPNMVEPQHGIFTETSLRHQLAGRTMESVVIAPVPWFPFTAGYFGRYGRYARVPREETRNGVRVLHPRYLQLPRIGMHAAPFALAKAARSVIEELIADGYDFDLIDAHYFYPDGVAAALLGRHFDKPVVISALGSDINVLPDYAWPRWLIRWAANRAAAVISVSAALKARLMALGIAADRIHVLRNGVDLSLFHPSSRDTARAALGIDGYTLLSVGHLIASKGHHRVIGALAELPDVQLIIVGGGPERTRLAQLALSLGVETRVRFAGVLSQDALRGYYAAADALVLASDREGWANVLLESMACGTPVLASAVGGTPEFITKHAAGRLLPSLCARGVAEAVRALRAHPPLRTDTRAYAEQFSWTDTTRAQLGLFAQATYDHTIQSQPYVHCR